MTRLFALLAALWIALASPVLAEDETEISEQDYVMGNVLLTMLHEVGHGLVDIWQLPVLGREEDAVDAFSVAFVIDIIENDEGLTDAQLDDLDTYLWSTADLWLAYGAQTDFDDLAIYAAEHSLDYQRFFSHMCLLVGSDPDYYSAWLEDFDMDEAELDIQMCEEQYELKSADWQYILEAERDESWKDQGQKGIVIKFKKPSKKYRRFMTMAQDWPWMEYFEQRMETQLKMPQPLVITFETCDGDANAYYDLEDQSVGMCYELMEEYADFYNSAG